MTARPRVAGSVEANLGVGAARSCDADGWRARLELGFEAGDGRTVLRRRRHFGPLRVQRGFHPEGFPCHSYLLHPPGGVVGGDRLEIDVTVADAAHALITTPAAGKFYRSAGPEARQRQQLRVGAGAALEWLPSLNIVHAGARVVLRSRFQLAAGSRLLAWDMLGLGRPGSGDRFEYGSVDSGLEVIAGDHPILSERVRIDGDGPLRHARWGLQGQRYLATLLAWPATPALLAMVRAGIGCDARPGRVACTLLPGPGSPAPDAGGLLVCRWLAGDGEALGAAMVQAWFLLRPPVLGRPACPPRIWAT